MQPRQTHPQAILLHEHLCTFKTLPQALYASSFAGKKWKWGRPGSEGIAIVKCYVYKWKNVVLWNTSASCNHPRVHCIPLVVCIIFACVDCRFLATLLHVFSLLTNNSSSQDMQSASRHELSTANGAMCRINKYPE